MSKQTIILVIVVIIQFFTNILLAGSLVWTRFYLRDVLKSPQVTYNPITEVVETPEVAEKVNLSAKVSATLVWWDQDNGFESIKENVQYLDSVSPFWYELNASGEIKPFSGAGDDEIVKYLQDNNVKITPIISNEFEQEPLTSILKDTQKRESHILDLVELAKDYDGISLNYENLTEDEKDIYSSFVADLAQSLHKENKTLTLHLYAKTDEPGTWNGPQSQDWEALGKSADKLKIMAYDFHWETSEAGAIAPPDWVEEVVNHAITLIPKEKIYLGIPLYGYDWIDEEGEGVTYEKSIEISELNSSIVEFKTETQSSYFSYTDNDGGYHEVYFEDVKSTKPKLEIVKQYKLGGLDFFRLGGEDPSTWRKVEAVLSN